MFNLAQIFTVDLNNQDKLKLKLDTLIKIKNEKISFKSLDCDKVES